MTTSWPSPPPSRADYLVTRDEDLLTLGRHADTEIVYPAKFLQLLEKERALQDQHVQLAQLTRAMRQSWTWRVGRLVVGPLGKLKQALSWYSKNFPRLLRSSSIHPNSPPPGGGQGGRASGLTKPRSEIVQHYRTTQRNNKAAGSTWDRDYYKTIQGWFDFGDIYDR